MSKLPSAFSKYLKPVARPQASAAATKSTIESVLQRAEEHLDKGEIKQAEHLCMTVLTKAPDNTKALMFAGRLAQDVGDIGLALVFLRKAMLRQPKSLQSHLVIAAAYFDAREYDNAIEHFQQAFLLKPDMKAELGALARAYTAAGKAELAVPLLEKAIKLLPDHPSLRLDLANAMIGLGRMDEAAEALRENIARGHRLGPSYRALADTRKFSGEPDELQAIANALARPGIVGNDKMQLHHAAGKILNDVGRHADAIDAFQESKAASGVDFDLQAFRRRVDALIASFTPALLKSKTGLGDPSEVPVFVVGMPRSGTTLTEQICASHPAVFGAGELIRLGTVLQTGGFVQKPDGTVKKHPQALTAAEAQSMTADYLAFLKRHSPSSARIVDKMPHNFQYVGMIALLFPNARIIHCTRDPIDNCLSCFFNTFNEDHGYNTDLRKLGLYYREYNRLMRHWNALLPGRIFEARYETMIADQEAETRRLIDFLGLPWDDACLRFYENDRTVTTPSRWQVRQPIYASSVRRWEKYGDKIQPLVDALGDLAKV
jgi:tetratricopeptide (TPR) repeat protein